MKDNELPLQDQFKNFRDEMNSYREYTKEYIDSSNFLCKTLFVDYEINRRTPLIKYLQTTSAEILEFVGHVCNEHDITWWLDYGNLLGAARHGNFVPWDDDVDISMLREDYNKFDNIITRAVKKYGLDEIIEVGYRPHLYMDGVGKFIQVYVRHRTDKSGKGKPILGNVDVFPYDYISEYDLTKFDEQFLDAKNKFFTLQKRFFNRQFILDTYYEDLNLTYEPTDYLLPGCEGPCGPDEIYPLYIYSTEDIFPLGEIEFAGVTYPCPKEIYTHLKKIYRDYLSIPKSLYRHDRISTYRYNTNNEEVFEKCLKMLRDVNAQFK